MILHCAHTLYIFLARERLMSNTCGQKRPNENIKDAGKMDQNVVILLLLYYNYTLKNQFEKKLFDKLIKCRVW